MKRIELKESGVLFNEEEHTYQLDGKELSGITGMLQRQLFPTEFDGIPQHFIQNAADYGTSVHQSCENFDKNWINDGTQEVNDYIELCKDYGLVHECSEYTVTDGTNWADPGETGESKMATEHLRLLLRTDEQESEGRPIVCHPPSQQDEERRYIRPYQGNRVCKPDTLRSM